MSRFAPWSAAIGLALASGLFNPITAAAQQASTEAAGWRPVPATATFITGDTWTEGGQTFRLYGVQSCIRGTTYTSADGRKRDCGEASLGMLAGLVRAWRPRCAPVARSSDTVFVACYADAATGQGTQRVELGTALIASGFAFAALDAKGAPVHVPYAVAEQQARAGKLGLWAFPDTPNPNAVLLNALRQAGPATPSR